MSAGTVAFETLGCRLNQAESEEMARQFRAQGYSVVEPEHGADVYVLNTCTVTHMADQKARHAISLTRRRSPHALLVVTGCYAERMATDLDPSTLVVGNAEKERLVPLVMERRPLRDQKRAPSDVTPGRTRSAVKIQEGCDDVCSYCIVPRTRGRERSIPVDDVVAQVGRRVAEGYREVVLTGTQPGYYGRSRADELDTAGLVRRILRETGIQRLRLSSLQPQNVTPTLLALFEDPRLCRHLHMPLQSGSEAVLSRMRRRYGLAEFRRAVETARIAIPGVAITTDIIAGFPGESDVEFEESLAFCREMAFAAMHVFPYSRRPGTGAARMPEQIGSSVKKERARRMLEAAREMGQAYRRGSIGATMDALWEQAEADGLWSGLTDTYIRVFARSERPLTNQLLPARLTKLHHVGLWAEL